MGLWDCVGNSLPSWGTEWWAVERSLVGKKVSREWAVGCLVWAGRVLCEVAGVIAQALRLVRSEWWLVL